MKISIIKYKSYAIWIAIGLYFLCYAIYEFYTPKSVGENDFPLMLEWTTKLNNRVEEISITNDHILTRLAYSLNSIDKANGNLLWKHIFNEETSSVISRNGIVYLVAKENLYAFDEETGKIKWQKSIWQNSGFYPSQNGTIKAVTDNHIIINFIADSFRVYNAKSGDFVWLIPAGRGEQNACTYKDSLFTFDDYISSYNLENGTLLWKDQNTETIGANVCENGKVYFTQDNSEIIAYDLETKSKIWRLPLALSGPYGLATFQVENDFLLIDDDTDVYIIDKRDGGLVKRIKGKDKPAFPQIIGNYLYVYYGFDRTIYAYNIDTWKESGVLRISPPILLYIDEKRLNHIDDMLIFFKGKTLFVYTEIYNE